MKLQIPLKSTILDAFSEQSISSGKHYLEIKIPSGSDGVLENLVVGLTYLLKKEQKIAIQAFFGAKGLDEEGNLLECDMAMGRFHVKRVPKERQIRSIGSMN